MEFNGTNATMAIQRQSSDDWSAQGNGSKQMIRVYGNKHAGV